MLRFPRTSRTFQLLLVIFVILGSFTLFSATVLHAQSECDDPFSGQNPRFNPGFWTLTNFCKHNVDYSEIISGGPPPDGIPPIDDPEFETIEQAQEWLQPQSPTIAVEVNGDARAYPLEIMIWHEITNDTVGGVPVTVTFCPLCNSGIVFNREVQDEILRFGVSGNLRNSDLIMWDSKTESWWQQFTGEAIVGDFTGTTLEVVPSLMASFAAFSEQFPEGKVLSRNTGNQRSYGSNPYAGYDTSSTPFLFQGTVDDRLFATERVLAGIISGAPIAYPFPILAEERVINDEIGQREIVAIWQPGNTSALDGGSINDSRDVGMAALYSRVLDDQVLTFTVDEEGIIHDDQTGSIWNVFGRSVEGSLEGSQLRQQVAAPHFWFAWAAFQPDTAIYGQ